MVIEIKDKIKFSVKIQMIQFLKMVNIIIVVKDLLKNIKVIMVNVTVDNIN